jgi:hypothetical protein
VEGLSLELREGRMDGWMDGWIIERKERGEGEERERSRRKAPRNKL